MPLDVEVCRQDVGRRKPAVRVRSEVLHRCDAAVSNAELIEGCRGGDIDAWNEMVSRYERLVYAIPLREGLTAADAAEISQSTFEILIESLERIREPERLGYWLMTVARRLTWRRRNECRAEVSVHEIPVEPDVDDHAAAWVRTVAVYDAVAELPAPCRELVFGLFFDPSEPSYERLSEMLGVAIGSIGPMRSRCLDRLRDRLQA